MKKILIMLCTVFMLGIVGCSAKVYTVEDLKQEIESEKLNVDKTLEIYEWLCENKKEELSETEIFVVKFINRLYDEFVEGNISESKFDEITDKIIKLDSSYEIYKIEINNKIKRLNDSNSKYFEAESAYNEGRYKDAIEFYSCVIIDDKNYNDSQTKINQAKERLVEEILHECDEMIAKQKYENAIGLLKNEKNYFMDTNLYEEKLNYAYEKYFEVYEANAEELMGKGEYYQALELIESFPMQGTYTLELKETIEEKYVKDILEKAEVAFAGSKDYAKAISILHTCKIDSQMITDKIRIYQAYIPVELATFEPIKRFALDIRGNFDNQYTMDVNKKKYTSQIYGRNDVELENNETGYVSYYLNNEYSKLTGTVYRPYGTLKIVDIEYYDSSPAYVKMYGDGILLWESPMITSKTYDSYDFEISVEGIRELRIEMSGRWREEYSYIYYPRVCIGDLMIQK